MHDGTGTCSLSSTVGTVVDSFIGINLQDTFEVNFLKNTQLSCVDLNSVIT